MGTPGMGRVSTGIPNNCSAAGMNFSFPKPGLGGVILDHTELQDLEWAAPVKGTRYGDPPGILFPAK